MTRRDYILISDVVKQFELPPEFIKALVRALKKQNVFFNEEMFYKAIERSEK